MADGGAGSLVRGPDRSFRRAHHRLGSIDLFLRHMPACPKLSWKLTAWSRIRMLDIYRSGGVVERLSLLDVHRNRSQDIRTFQVEWVKGVSIRTYD